jgi:TrmH family RNA methyltransferase
MLAKTIISLQHPLVKHWVQLRTDKSFREEEKQVLLMGEKLIRELSEEMEIKTLITNRPVSDIPSAEQWVVTDAILKKITGLEQPDGFAAEVALPAQQDLREKKYLLILDQISDPGNLGTLLRSALALEWEGVIFTPGTVDPFNDKALRAAKGANFRLPYAKWTHEELVQWIQEKTVHAYTADIEGRPINQIAFKPPLALILSNEGAGPGLWSESCAEKITIPMNQQIESLNVASSGAILLYTMRSFHDS